MASDENISPPQPPEFSPETFFPDLMPGFLRLLRTVGAVRTRKPTALADRLYLAGETINKMRNNRKLLAAGPPRVYGHRALKTRRKALGNANKKLQAALQDLEQARLTVAPELDFLPPEIRNIDATENSLNRILKKSTRLESVCAAVIPRRYRNDREKFLTKDADPLRLVQQFTPVKLRYIALRLIDSEVKKFFSGMPGKHPSRRVDLFIRRVLAKCCGEKIITQGNLNMMRLRISQHPDDFDLPLVLLQD